MITLVPEYAGFIGFHSVKKLPGSSYHITGIDDINYYYDVNLKYDRPSETGISHDAGEWHRPGCNLLFAGYTLLRMDIEEGDKPALLPCRRGWKGCGSMKNSQVLKFICSE